MLWQEIRQHYPEQWLLVEALTATTDANKRIVDQLAVVDSFGNSTQALEQYSELHKQSPDRELYVPHKPRTTGHNREAVAWHCASEV